MTLYICHKFVFPITSPHFSLTFLHMFISFFQQEIWLSELLQKFCNCHLGLPVFDKVKENLINIFSLFNFDCFLFFELMQKWKPNLSLEILVKRNMHVRVPKANSFLVNTWVEAAWWPLYEQNYICFLLASDINDILEELSAQLFGVNDRDKRVQAIVTLSFMFSLWHVCFVLC